MAARSARPRARDAGRLRRAGDWSGCVPQLRDPDAAHRRQVGARRSSTVPARARSSITRSSLRVPGGSLAALDGADGRPGFGGMGTVGVINGVAASSQGLGGWAVGATPQMMPEGIATRLPKGSDFLLQVHFHPSGKPETEKSLIGIYFSDRPPDKEPDVGVSAHALRGRRGHRHSRRARRSTRSRTRSRCLVT